jgi:type I restriction enzyme S subunit
MFSSRISKELLIDQLSPDSYDPVMLTHIGKVANGERLERYLTRAPRLGVTGTIASSYVESDTPGAVPYLTTKQINGLYAYPKACKYITEEADAKWEKCRVTHGDILINKSGNVGAAAIMSCPHLSHVNSVSDLINIRVKNGEAGLDSAYFVVYLNSAYAQDQLKRLSGGAVFDHVSIYAIPNIRCFRPKQLAQNYIGDKVRQAGSLRCVADFYHDSTTSLVQPPELLECLSLDESISSMVPGMDLSPARLDPKFYGKRALGVLDACRRMSTATICDLNPEVSNGFEERSFVNAGIPYVTVSEVSSGRLQLTTAPHIASNTPIPQKARISKTCVLVVRSGSIGTAVKVHADDSHAVISSHLICLRFDCEVTASLVAAFLNSDVGKCLMWKISYGAVQSQIGQDELLQLPIPNHCFEAKFRIFDSMAIKERAIRCEESLLLSAKHLVEALIEGTISEDELVVAQTQSAEGNRTGDRRILERLYQGGIDAKETAPLFPDLEAYYATLEIAKQSPYTGGRYEPSVSYS